MPSHAAAVSGGRGHRTASRLHLSPHMPSATPAAVGDDALLLLLLVSTWELRTGRKAPLRPPTDMTAAELIDFWSDPDDGPCPPGPPAPHPGLRA